MKPGVIKKIFSKSLKCQVIPKLRNGSKNKRDTTDICMWLLTQGRHEDLKWKYFSFMCSEKRLNWEKILQIQTFLTSTPSPFATGFSIHVVLALLLHFLFIKILNPNPKCTRKECQRELGFHLTITLRMIPSCTWTQNLWRW